MEKMEQFITRMAVNYEETTLEETYNLLGLPQEQAEAATRKIITEKKERLQERQGRARTGDQGKGTEMPDCL